MISPHNYQFTSLSGKPLIIAKKAGTTNQQQGLVLQTTNAQKTVLINPSQIQVKFDIFFLTLRIHITYKFSKYIDNLECSKEC